MEEGEKLIIKMERIKDNILDYGKLKEEDRRFILNYHNEKIISYENLSLLVTAIFISLLAVLVSSYFIIDKLRDLYSYVIGNVIYIIFLIGLVLVSGKIQSKIERLKLEHKDKYDKLYMIHFKYTGKNGRKKHNRKTI